MSTETYAIVFKGDVVEGFEKPAVQAQLAKLLKLDAAKAGALFSGKQIVLKKTADKAEAAKYGKALKKIGADIKVRVIRQEAAPAPAQPAFEKAEAPVFQPAEDAPAFQAATPERAARPRATEPKPVTENPASSVDTSGITLAPNEGDLFDPPPPAEAPEIDTSGIPLAENDGSPLVVPRAEVVVELDLSEFSVAENDGSPLVEPSDEPVPIVEAPDFGLDEPGAILETLKEEKELLNP
ncbi:MAG: hypothetical protein O3B72_10795, partial [Proteobacteria bacterium]|nr:hypothetical protein [Pseudomonadota bacterium]